MAIWLTVTRMGSFPTRVCRSLNECEDEDHPDSVDASAPGHIWLLRDDTASTDTVVALFDEDVITESDELSEPLGF